jgi:hypothetical protein
MIAIGLALKGYSIEASDGPIGRVADFLFDDKRWSIRWMVVDASAWLADRKVLIHPSVIRRVDAARRAVTVALTMAQIKAGPDIASDEPVSRQMQHDVYGHYGWDPLWGGGDYYRPLAPTVRPPLLPDVGGANKSKLLETPGGSDQGDPDLRSIVELDGYKVQATDGSIGHLENVLADEADWTIRSLVVDTRNWWPGQHVMISPRAVQAIEWVNRTVRIDLSRDSVKASPPMIGSDPVLP